MSQPPCLQRYTTFKEVGTIGIAIGGGRSVFEKEGESF
jgi:hypothetical protein